MAVKASSPSSFCRHRFLKDLEDRIFEDVVFSDVCDIIHYHAQHNFPVYIDYVRNQIYQEKTFTTLMWGRLFLLFGHV